MVYKRELTIRQEEIYELIKSMHDSGLGYRRIAKRLRDMNIKTARGSVFKNNNVFLKFGCLTMFCVYFFLFHGCYFIKLKRK